MVSKLREKTAMDHDRKHWKAAKVELKSNINIFNWHKKCSPTLLIQLSMKYDNSDLGLLVGTDYRNAYSWHWLPHYHGGSQRGHPLGIQHFPDHQEHSPVHSGT